MLWDVVRLGVARMSTLLRTLMKKNKVQKKKNENGARLKHNI